VDDGYRRVSGVITRMGRRREYGEFVRKGREFVYARDQRPWTPNPNGMGQPSKNDPRALVICLLLKIWLGKPYRDMVSFPL
jgi:hypothetical protein